MPLLENRAQGRRRWNSSRFPLEPHTPTRLPWAAYLRLERDAQRAQALRERKYQQSQQLLDQADNMLKFPLSEVKRTVAIDESGRRRKFRS